MHKLWFTFVLILSVFRSQAASDLLITSITHVEDCTTLTWNSHPGEFYTVYWTDRLNPPVFWRVAEVNVASGGGTTTWSDGACASMMLRSSAPTAGESGKTMSEEERAKWVETMRQRSEAAVKFLKEKMAEATTRTAEQRKTLSVDEAKELIRKQAATNTEGESGGTALRSLYAGSSGGGMKFYRVARTGVSGFVDGWGGAFGTNTPVSLTVVTSANVIAVSASPRGAGVHSLALRGDGTVAAWGANSFGECNVPTNLTQVVAVAAGGRHSVALLRNGSITNWGDNSLGQVTNAPAGLTNVCAVAAGLWHTLALKADGTVAVWGDLFNRTNNVPAGLSNVTAIAAGPRHCLALKSDGKVVAWGFSHAFLNNFLPTNLPSTLSNVVAISAGMEHNEALLQNGTVVVWGNTNNPGLGTNGLSLTNATAASAGWHYGTALLPDTTVQSWGQTDTDLTMDSIVALSAGADHVLVVRTNNDAPVIRRHPRNLFVPQGMATNINVFATSATNLTYQWQREMITGWSNLTGATATNYVFSSLQDSDDGNYRVLVSTPLRTIISRVAMVETMHAPIIASQSPEQQLRRAQNAGANLSVLITNKGARFLTYRWFKDGQPIETALGAAYAVLFFTTNVEGSYQVIVSNRVGSATSAVWQVSMTLFGEATVWGDNTYGQNYGRSRDTTLIAISAGGFHTLGLRENGTVIAWGWNNSGQTNVPTGLTNVIAIAGGGSHSLALLENGTVRAWGSGIPCNQTNVPAGLTNVVAIAAGGPQSIALRRDGTVVSWGCTNIPSGVSNVAAIAASPTHALVLYSNGTVQAWSDTNSPYFTPPPGLSNVVAIASGFNHALALKRDGTVVGWGVNLYGETNAPPGLSNVMHIAAGYQFSLALKNDGTVVAWGRNDLGQTNVLNGLGNVRDISAGVAHSVALTYNNDVQYPVNVAQDLLLICNTNVESRFVKDYYLAHRPLVSQANVLEIGYSALESITKVDFTNMIHTPVLNWLAENPTKRPKYWILFLDVPTRINEITNIVHQYDYISTSSVSYALSRLVEARSPYITHIHMGYTNHIGDTNACRAYIDKLAHFGSNYSPGKVIISASAGGYDNSRYFFEHNPNYNNFAEPAKEGVSASGVTASNILYTAGTPLIDRGTNVAGYLTHGIYSWGDAAYALNSNIVFTGSSSWYIMMTVESLNGFRYPEDRQQGTFIKWFSEKAFGGTDFSNTPVAAVSHTDEPLQPGVNDSRGYFGSWARGKIFGFAAWESRRTPHFQAVGDPLVKR